MSVFGSQEFAAIRAFRKTDLNLMRTQQGMYKVFKDVMYKKLRNNAKKFLIVITRRFTNDFQKRHFWS